MSGLLRNISWLGIANVAVKPIWFLFVTAMCMRILGVDGYGVMNASLALAVMGTTFTDLGMARYTVREVARDRDRSSLIFSNFFLLRGSLAILATGVVTLGAVALGYRGPALLSALFACVYIAALEMTNYCRSMYEAFESLQTQAVMLVVEKVLVVAGGSTMLLLTRTPQWTLAGMAGGMVITTLLNGARVSGKLAKLRTGLFDPKFIRAALWTMIPLGLAGVFFNVYFRVNLVLVEWLLGETQAGQFGAAFRIIEALNILPSVIVVSAIYPRLSRLLHEGEPTEFRRLFARSQLSLGAISLGIALGLTLFSGVVIHLLDPNPLFEPAGPVLSILAWAFPIFCANSLLYSALIADGDDKFTAAALGIAVLVNVGLNLAFIPVYGIKGAAVASIIPELVLIAAYTVRYRRRIIGARRSV